MRLAQVGEGTQGATDGNGAPMGDSGSGSGSGTTGTGTGVSGGGTGTGSVGSGAGSGNGSQTGSGLASTLPVPGLVGAGGVGGTGVLANTGNPSNPGVLGTVLVAAGNAVLAVNSQTPGIATVVDAAVPGSVPLVGTVVRVLGDTGKALVDTGQGRIYLVDGVTAALGQGVSLNVLDKPLLPAGANPLIGASLASATQNTGSLATLGVDAAGNLVKAVVTPLGAGNGVVGAVLPTSSTLITNGAGQVVGAVLGGVTSAGTGGGLSSVTGAIVPVTSALTGGGVLAPVTGATSGLVTATLGKSTLLNGGTSPAVGASVISPAQSTGTVATAGALSGGNLVTGTVTGLTNTVGTATGAAPQSRGLLGGLVGH